MVVKEDSKLPRSGFAAAQKWLTATLFFIAINYFAR